MLSKQTQEVSSPDSYPFLPLLCLLLHSLSALGYFILDRTKPGVLKNTYSFPPEITVPSVPKVLQVGRGFNKLSHIRDVTLGKGKGRERVAKQQFLKIH